MPGAHRTRKAHFGENVTRQKSTTKSEIKTCLFGRRRVEFGLDFASGEHRTLELMKWSGFALVFSAHRPTTAGAKFGPVDLNIATEADGGSELSRSSCHRILFDDDFSGRKVAGRHDKSSHQTVSLHNFERRAFFAMCFPMLLLYQDF